MALHRKLMKKISKSKIKFSSQESLETIEPSNSTYISSNTHRLSVLLGDDLDLQIDPDRDLEMSDLENSKLSCGCSGCGDGGGNCISFRSRTDECSVRLASPISLEEVAGQQRSRSGSRFSMGSLCNDLEYTIDDIIEVLEEEVKPQDASSPLHRLCSSQENIRSMALSPVPMEHLSPTSCTKSQSMDHLSPTSCTKSQSMDHLSPTSCTKVQPGSRKFQLPPNAKSKKKPRLATDFRRAKLGQNPDQSDESDHDLDPCETSIEPELPKSTKPRKIKRATKMLSNSQRMLIVKKMMEMRQELGLMQEHQEHRIMPQDLRTGCLV